MHLKRPDHGPKQARTFADLVLGAKFKRHDSSTPTAFEFYEITKEPYAKDDGTMWAEATIHKYLGVSHKTIFSLADHGVTAYTNGAWSNVWLEKLD